MPTYVLTADDSDITPSWPNTSVFDKDMVEGAGGGGNLQASIPASSIRSASFITVANKPNSDAFEDGGTQTAELRVGGNGNMNLRARCRIVMLTLTGFILQSVSFTDFQTCTANTSFSFSPVAPTWFTAENCTNRLAIEWEFENIDTMQAKTLDVDLGTANSEVITDISEDSGSCGGIAIVKVAD